MSVFVGQARVVATESDGRARVLVLGEHRGPTVAEWAIPFRYEPRSGDLVLVYGQGGSFWITGVVQGNGTSQLAFRGDTAIRAPRGLRFSAAGGLRLDAPQLDVRTEHLEAEIDHLQERSDEHDLEVMGTIDERAGSCAHVVDGDEDQTAARHTTVAERVVKIDGGLLKLS